MIGRRLQFVSRCILRLNFTFSSSRQEIDAKDRIVYYPGEIINKAKLDQLIEEGEINPRCSNILQVTNELCLHFFFVVERFMFGFLYSDVYPDKTKHNIGRLINTGDTPDQNNATFCYDRGRRVLSIKATKKLQSSMLFSIFFIDLHFYLSDEILVAYGIQYSISIHQKNQEDRTYFVQGSTIRLKIGSPRTDSELRRAARYGHLLEQGRGGTRRKRSPVAELQR